jgi:aspartate/methionine/tyrosine aminotransferase
MAQRCAAAVDQIRRASRRPTARPAPDVCPLQLGEPDFATPPHVVEAMVRALAAGHTHYAPPLGDPQLRCRLAAEVNKVSARRYESAEIVVTMGGTAAINAAVLALVDCGSRVVIPEPTYSLYADAVTLAGGIPVPVACGSDLRLDLDAIDVACAGARLLVLCHPCNPTGMVIRPSELERIADIARRHDVVVLSDEAYDHIVFDEGSFRSALMVSGLAERLVYCQTFSKTYAMTGWRIGYVAAPEQFATAVAVAQRTINGAVNSAVQRAALVALEEETWPRSRLLDYRRRREVVVEALTSMPGVELRAPEGTFYAFPRFSQGLTSDQMTTVALKHGVAVRSGREFGESGESYLRVAFCVDDDRMALGLARLHQAFRAVC